MDSVIIVPPRPPVSRSQSCLDNLLGLGHLCSSVFKESNEKCIPHLKDLAQNTVNVHGIQIVPPQRTTEQPGKSVTHVTTDCPVSRSSSDCGLTLCGNQSFQDDSKIGEKLPRRKSADFYRIMQQDMKIEKNRLETFRNVWPLSYIDPSDLAAVGFFYLQCSDKVQCAFCRGIIVDWAPGDDPLTEHSLHFPLCPFLMKRDVGNVPISGRNPFMDQDKNSYPEKLGPFRSNNSTHAAASVSHSKFPKMADKEKRRCTFHSWHYQAVKPDDLTEAGFFSTGTSDIVACFSCGGTLGHWDLGDDPWLEHKKHFPHCEYLKSARHSTVKTFCKGYHESISKPVCESQPADVAEHLKSSICIEASKIFSEKLVREALERQLNKKGQGFQSLEELCTVILEIQDEAAEKKPEVGVESQEQSKSATGERNTCKICYDNEMGVVFLPCGHMMACPKCAASIKTCPLCRKVIEGSVRAYIS